MDILYPLKYEENNFELRYSLRSLVNLPHDKIFMCGFKPSWVTSDVIEIHVEQNPFESKYLRSIKNLIAAMDDDRISENFILMNDDFFILKPIDPELLPALHRGPLNDMINYFYRKHTSSAYTHGLIAVFNKLEEIGVSDPLSYELHVPMVINKTNFKKALAICLEIEGFGKRTIYGNMFLKGGEEFADVKYTDPRKAILDDMPFVSTDEGSFLNHQIGGYIRGRFIERSKYEKDLPWVRPVIRGQI